MNFKVRRNTNAGDSSRLSRGAAISGNDKNGAPDKPGSGLLRKSGVYPSVVAPDAMVARDVPRNPGLTTRVGSHPFFVAGEEKYAHTSVPRRRKKGRELLAAGKITEAEAEAFLNGLNPAKAEFRSHPDHKAEIICYMATVRTKGIPQHGKERFQGSEEVYLAKLAAAIGLKASSSICRHLRRAKLIKRKPRAYSPSRFEHAMPEGTEQFEGKYHRTLKLKDLSRVKLPVKFRANAQGRHYYHEPAWLRHPRAGIPKNPLIVMSYLCSQGLLQMREGKMIYSVRERSGNGDPAGLLRQISRGTSLHPETVRRAIAYLEGKQEWRVRVKYSKPDGSIAYRVEKGPIYKHAQPLRDAHGEPAPILRFVRGKREKYVRPDGSIGYIRKKSEIVYVAENKFTLELAHEELVRFITAAGKLRGHNPMWRAKAEEIHQGMINAWVGTERHIQTLWAESRKKMLEAGIPGEVVEALFEEEPP